MKQKKLVALLAVVLVLVLCVGLFVACDKTCTHADTNYDGKCDKCGEAYDNGEPKVYSYRMGPSDIPTSWNYHTYQSNSSTYVLDYSSDTLYTFDYNEDKTGYIIVPSMASANPTDVTAEYVGQYGIEEGDTGKAWSIPLKTNLKFDNGDTLNANTFVESMKLLLNPEAANYRADNVYTGNLAIYGAENYVKQGQILDVDNSTTRLYTSMDALTKGADGVYVQASGLAVSFSLDAPNSWCSGYSMARLTQMGYLDATAFASLSELADEDGKVAVTDESIALIAALINTENWGNEPASNVPLYMTYEQEYPEMDFEEVGFFATDDNTLVVVSMQPFEENFYLYYNLMTSFFLVHPETYRQCISTEQGVYANNYGTSVDTFVGYGPYKLTQYLADSTIILEKNPLWHGFSEEEYVEGTYQTDRVVYTKVNDDATRLEMFLKGELDSYGLQAADMADYITSDYVYYNDSESTWYLAMNPDLDTLKRIQATATPETEGNAVVKTVLTIAEFRQALSWSLDREQFNLTLSPTSGIAKSLLSSMIVADPETGLTYRATDDGKDAILEYWGLADKWGEGKEYATRDDAIASITGFDPEGAKALFNTAYTKAVEENLITADMIASGKWEVQIVIGNPVTANFYTKGFEFLKTNWTNAVKGTPFEGHLSFVFSQELGSTQFGTYLRNGSVDLLFGVGYGGSMFDPYSMMSCFTDNLQYDPFTDKEAIMLDIDLDLGDGMKTYRASLYAWCTDCINGTPIKASVIVDGMATGDPVEINAGPSADGNLRTRILSKVEAKIMTLSNIFPMQTDSSASLRCMRINYATEEYVVGMGRGGVQYYTYSMHDAQFVAYAKSQDGGVLNYK